MKNKKTIIIILILLLIFFGLGRIVKKRGEKKMSLKKNNEKNFEKVYNEFQKEYRAAYLFCMEGDTENSREKMNESLELWKNIMSEFASTSPIFFKKNVNWDIEKKTILEHIEAGYEFAVLGKCEKVLEQNKDIDTKINALSVKKEIIPISPEIIDFGQYVKALSLAKNKNDANKDFIELKISFLKIKEISKKPEYLQKISEIEKIIAEMDSSNAKKWLRARDELLVLNKKLFLEFE